MSRITFQKRQKEMKRQEKQKAKAERRAQKKLAKRNGVGEGVGDDVTAGFDIGGTGENDSIEVPAEETGSEPS
jgi:hypothetical protein